MGEAGRQDVTAGSWAAGDWAFAGVVGFTAAVGAFVLPFAIPLAGRGPVYSATYPVGAENRVAMVMVALLSVVVAGWGYLRARGLRTGLAAGGGRVSLGGMLVGAGLVAAWTAGLGCAVARSGLRYGEATYFLERMRDAAQFGGHLYTGLEFPYGPLLLYPGVWLGRAVGMNGGYFGWLTTLNVAGVLMAGYVVNRLPLAGWVRWAWFGAFCLEQANPLLGANYSLGKFMLPLAVLLWGVSRRAWGWRAGALAAGHLLVVLVSPELGVGLAAGIVGWSVLAWWRGREAGALLACAAPVVGYGVFLALYGRGFLERLGHAAGGALNLIVEPLPHLLVFVAAVVWLAPMAVGIGFRKDDGAVLGGVWLLGLGLLPGALGRCDPLHVLFNGFPFLLLSFVGIERYGRRAVWVWTAAVALVCVQVQVTNFAIYRGSLRDVAAAVRRPGEVQGLNVARLRAMTGGAGVATPALLTLPLADELALRADGQFVEDKEPGLADIWTPAEEQAKIARLRDSGWALLPAGEYTQAEGSDNTSRVKRMFRLGYRYKERHAPYVVGRLLEAEMAADWVVAGRFGEAVLYRRVR